MENKIELTDPKNQIQWYAYVAAIIFGVLSIVFIAIESYIQSAITCILLSIVVYFVFIRKLNYKRILFDERSIYFDDQQISFDQITEIKTTGPYNQYGAIKYKLDGEIKKIYFAGFFRKNLELLKNKTESKNPR